ncbi:methyl-accepting chemotaxis protein [Falsiroseomonas sp.]|uniref:methyl-accepting chemotaxis protein n=1 Tax=Falsiroseomonas sp. TaxID=2870721 RepID=UPI003F6FCA9F
MFISRTTQALQPIGFMDRRGARDRRAAVRDLGARMAALELAQPMVEIGLDGSLIDATPPFAALLGTTVEALRGLPHAGLLAEMERGSEAQRRFQEEWQRGAAATALLRHRHPDGTERLLKLSAMPVRDEAERIEKALVLVADVTARKQAEANAQGQLAAIDKAQAVIEFTLDGRILRANANFLATLGYTLEEVRGQHHSLFVEAAYRQSPEYRAFWDKLGRGQYDAGQYKRIGKGGREVWIQASYNPILDAEGKPFKVVKYATDITEQKLQTANFEGQLAAIDKAQAVIEFSLDGRILQANANFLRALGYTLEEVRGQHHSLFVPPDQRHTPEYRAFWDKLGRGEYDSGQYLRIGKGGQEIWIQASYNPILDLNGRPFKVVKYATDVTAQVRAAQALAAAVAQTEEIVAGAQRNDFSRRIPLAGLDGAIGRLCGGVNSMLDTMEAQLRVAQALKDAVAETQGIVAAAQANDLSRRIGLEGKEGAIGELCAGVNGMLDTMSGVVATITESCGTISTAAREIAMGNTDLSQRTEEQASSLEETSASLEELTGTVRQNADNAQQANKLASSASEIAERGGRVVTEVVQTMDGITQSSRKINDIIGVIDEIAFQTNILALNAAVEAARAGEQGRGFAVVAAEVRNLAQRSANAAKEIKALISDSVGKVDSGSKLVASAGQTMEEIVISVKRVTDIMAEISAASQEQSTGIEQVNTAVVQMDKITQQNAALVEEAAAAAKSMEEQTEQLAAMVAGFVLPPGLLTAPAAPAAKPRAKAAAPRSKAVRAADDDRWEAF